MSDESNEAAELPEVSWLRGLLRCEAFVLFSAAVAVVLPSSWMAAIHAWLGMGELAQTPLMEYLTRSVSALYALCGAVFWYLSNDVRRYVDLIRFLAWLKLISGISRIVLDATVDLPMFWLIGEGPVVIGLAVATLYCLRRIIAR
jgi:hypothetical protein